MSETERGATGPESVPPPTSEDSDAAERVWHNLRSLVLERYDRRKQVSEALGMSFIRAKALSRIAEGTLTLRELSAYLVTDAPYTSVVVEDLVKRGLVERTENPADRRSKLVHATEEGRAKAERARRLKETPPQAVRALSAEELVTLNGLVTRLLEAPIGE
ncbi:MarR family transcriptional regulator [Streptomyces sp. ODS28]|uniref:MarR family winged helix-turn-helix transcriptional regulator n=1 Tax=Streptomyces sp. ODS28 TaxID=3136688 RepID=UPI0031E6314A